MGSSIKEHFNVSRIRKSHLILNNGTIRCIQYATEARMFFLSINDHQAKIVSGDPYPDISQFGENNENPEVAQAAVRKVAEIVKGDEHMMRVIRSLDLYCMCAGTFEDLKSVSDVTSFLGKVSKVELTGISGYKYEVEVKQFEDDMQYIITDLSTGEELIAMYEEGNIMQVNYLEYPEFFKKTMVNYINRILEEA